MNPVLLAMYDLQSEDHWKGLLVPDENKVQSQRQYKKMTKKYRNTLDAYRAMASTFHKDLLKKKEDLKKGRS